MKVCKIRQCELCGEEFRTDAFTPAKFSTLKTKNGKKTFAVGIRTPFYPEFEIFPRYTPLNRHDADVCPSCLRAEVLKIVEGWGAEEDVECDHCSGKGKLTYQYPVADPLGGGEDFVEAECPHCHGTGKEPE